MHRIVVVANRDKPEALKLAREAERELLELGREAVVSTGPEDDLSPHRADLAVVFGGDGTVLSAVRRLGAEPPPILAFNTGHLGYLAENSPDSMPAILAEAFEGGLWRSRRMMIEGGVAGSGSMAAALNEFVISFRHNHRQLTLSVKVDGEELMVVRGDGMIISTPTGSTAYSLSAGGPVASHELAAVILTPLCPHQLANRSLVLNPAETVGVSHHGDHTVEVMADGHQCADLARGEEFTVRRSDRSVTFLHRPRGRYKLLREKLGWGWRVDGPPVVEGM